MTDLFDAQGPRRLSMDGADVVLHPSPDLGAHPDELFRRLKADIPWEQGRIRTARGEVPEPRLTSWHGDVGYSYSGRSLAPKPWTPLLASLRDRVAAAIAAHRPDEPAPSFNSVLLNAYRNGRDSIGMHSDDEPELGARPVIASVSLGCERIFDLARKDGSSRPVHVPLSHGSLLVMAGDTQRNWRHGIAKTRIDVGERINLTFRLTRKR